MKKLMKGIIFLTLFLFLFYIITVTLKFKDDIGIHQIEDFYRLEDNSIDVISIGSSHEGVNIDPEILLEQYGIKSYNLWASVQPAWNSYYYLKEALKTQSPSLVCVETFIMAQNQNYSDYSRAIYNTLGMKPSIDKVNAIKVSVTPDLQKDFLLEWPTFHTRYSELKQSDFERYFWNYHFSSGKIDSGYDSFENDTPVLVKETETEALSSKQEEYLRKIIDLCQEKEIPLLLFTTPYNASEIDQKKFNRIAEIAAEYGSRVTYKNFLYDIDEIPVNFAVDYADGGGHFNNYGIEKYTMYFGKYLKDHFEIPVRNEEYAERFNLSKLYSCAYRLPESFSGNGTNTYIDTKQKLYDDSNRDWTLFADFATDIYSEDKVYFSCYAEEDNNYRGLLVKREDNLIYIVLGDNYYVDTPVPEEGYVRMAIKKEDNKYSVFINGEQILDQQEILCDEYNGSLLIGCEQDLEGVPYRYSASNVFEMEIYNEAVSDKDMMHWEKLDRNSAEKISSNIQQSVAYYMDTPFYGNGVDQYLDTGVHLYDDPSRNWTLLTELDLTCDKSADDLVYLSCFNEEADNYHGLIIRYKDDKVEAVLGNTYYLDIPDSGQNTMKLAIVKNEGIYTVYVDGQEFASDISSYCSSYMGNLLVGCQENGGLPIRISPVTVKQLEIYDEIVPANEIAGW